MNTEEREKLVEIVKQSNEVIMGNVAYADATPVTPALNLNDIVMAHVKSQCPECGKYLANVNEQGVVPTKNPPFLRFSDMFSSIRSAWGRLSKQ